MAALIVLLLALFRDGGTPLPKPVIDYVVRVDAADRSGWWVELRVQNAPDTFRVAMAAHPEYDDRYWRYISALTAESAAGPAAVERADSAVWRVAGRGGEVVIRYRLELPPAEGPPRAAWRPVLAEHGAFLGGPHTFLYVVGAERTPVRVRLDLPAGWDVATGLTPAGPRTFTAPDADALIDSPILAGRFRRWQFSVDGVPHHVVYWPLPDAAAFDTVRFLAGIEAMVRQAVGLFGGMPYPEYTFVFQDGAYGGLEHTSSVTLGAPSRDLAESVTALLPETAHEFVHTWNLMRLRPAEYLSLDYRTQPPTAGLWFSEGLTMFYADLLLRRAGLPVPDSTRVAHLERLIGRYLASPGNSRFSAEAVSRVAYNAGPGALGDYSASTHLQGELIGTMLDLIVRDATDGARSMDDVMRAMLDRFAGRRGFEGRDVERVVEDVCRCDVTPLFDAHVRNGGRPMDFDRYLGLLGLRTRITREPAVWGGRPERDLRIFAWEPPGEGGLRLIVTDPSSIWGRAGFHTGDRLTAVDGSPATTWPEFRGRLRNLAMGDSIRLEVRRPGGPHAATVVLTGFERPVVRIEDVPGASARQRVLREAWLRSRP
jgi:predicted metalloprotease with PDZ domain